MNTTTSTIVGFFMDIVLSAESITSAPKHRDDKAHEERMRGNAATLALLTKLEDKCAAIKVVM